MSFEQLMKNKHIVENYKEAEEMFNKSNKKIKKNYKCEFTTHDMEMALSHGAIIMFGVFLDEIEKGNLIIKEKT